MGYKNIQHIHFASNLQIDKIVGTYTGSFTSTAPTSGNTVTNDTTTVDTTIEASLFFQGIYSIDGGTTWNDFENSIYDTAVGHVLFPYFSVSASHDSTNGLITIVADNYYNFYTSSGVEYTVMYKIAIIAAPDTGVIEPQPVGSPIWFNSNYNYQKILSDNTDSVYLPAGGSEQTFTYAHNLGYIPKIRTFFKTSAGVMYELANYTAGAAIDTDNVYVTMFPKLVGDITGTLYTRIYYDS